MFKKIATGLAGGALFFAAVLPAFADTTVEIIGNGAGSDNSAKVETECTQVVTQSNATNADVDLTVIGNSGNNTASGNTGGDVEIDTGDVTNSVKVKVTGGENIATLPDCCCCDSGTEVTIKGNGKNSDNSAWVKKKSTTVVGQASATNAEVEALVVGNSGKNKAKYNTGGDKVEVKTGSVENRVRVRVRGGSNVLL